MLVEGVSVRSVERLTGVHRDTILRLLVLAGQRCERLREDRIRQVSVRDIQWDEIWGFVGCKEKNNVGDDPARGDAYCFVALERNSNLVLSWHLGLECSGTVGGSNTELGHPPRPLALHNLTSAL
jgi:hypothetical protein